VAGLFFTIGFIFGLLPHKFNHAAMIGNSIVAAYLVARGLSVYIGFWTNELTLLGQMKREGNIQELDPMFFAWFGAVVVLSLSFVPIQYYGFYKHLTLQQKFPYKHEWQTLPKMFHEEAKLL